jgi:DNA-directed RNA polymerase beta subunit
VAALQARTALTRPPAPAQEDAWTVITAFFEEKGLVRQQLDSFNEFVNSQMQEIVDESGQLVIKPESQHMPGQEAELEQREIHISFNQIYLSKPTMTEADGETSGMFPNEARLRNLTCAAPPGPPCSSAARRASRCAIAKAAPATPCVHAQPQRL